MNFADLLANPSIKRAVVGGITAALVALNKKLGLDMDGTSLTLIVGLAVAFIGQSAVVDVKKAGMDAAAKVNTTAEAATELSK